MKTTVPPLRQWQLPPPPTTAAVTSSPTTATTSSPMMGHLSDLLLSSISSMTWTWLLYFGFYGVLWKIHGQLGDGPNFILNCKKIYLQRNRWEHAANNLLAACRVRTRLVGPCHWRGFH
jgi:hypothetical protein